MANFNQIKNKIAILLLLSFYFYVILGEEPTHFSNIEINPKVEIIDSKSTSSFMCINHANDDAPLEVSLSKSQSTNQVEIITNHLNRTALSIQLRTHDYVGIFNLLCYVRGKKEHGMQSDIIVKPPRSVLRMKEACKVYQDSYLKCIFRASAYAKAIQNNYPFSIHFEEINQPEHSRIYSNMKFLKDESTDEYLVFRWNPTNDRVFPNGLQMKMNLTLKYLEPSIYIFDTTPVFVIEPAFQLNLTAHDSISLTFEKHPSNVLCQKSISEPSQNSSKMTWSDIGGNPSEIIFDKLGGKRTYLICIRCRKKSTDPYSEPVCRQAATMNVWRSEILRAAIVAILIFCSFLLVLAVILVMCQGTEKIRCKKREPLPESIDDNRNNRNSSNSSRSSEPSECSHSDDDSESSSMLPTPDIRYKPVIVGASGIDLCFAQVIEPSK